MPSINVVEAIDPLLGDKAMMQFPITGLERTGATFVVSLQRADAFVAEVGENPIKSLRRIPVAKLVLWKNNTDSVSFALKQIIKYVPPDSTWVVSIETQISDSEYGQWDNWFKKFKNDLPRKSIAINLYSAIVNTLFEYGYTAQFQTEPLLSKSEDYMATLLDCSVRWPGGRLDDFEFGLTNRAGLEANLLLPVYRNVCFQSRRNISESETTMIGEITLLGKTFKGFFFFRSLNGHTPSSLLHESGYDGLARRMESQAKKLFPWATDVSARVLNG